MSKKRECQRYGGVGTHFVSKTKGPIVFKGYWIWWCETHKRPVLVCQNEELNGKLKKIAAILREKRGEG